MRLTPYITILEHGVTPKLGQTFGQVSSGYIRLRGPLTQASFLESEAKLNSYTQNKSLAPYCFSSTDFGTRIDCQVSPAC
jgi:hypothetical protein